MRTAYIEPFEGSERLAADLCEREYSFTKTGTNAVMILERKAFFKKRNQGLSPDDGDGATLAMAPEYTLAARRNEYVVEIDTNQYRARSNAIRGSLRVGAGV